jgi:hypothetical protein
MRKATSSLCLIKAYSCAILAVVITGYSLFAGKKAAPKFYDHYYFLKCGFKLTDFSEEHSVSLFIILLLFILTANGVSPGGSGTTIRHNTQVTHITQNNATIKRNTLHKTAHIITNLHRMKMHNHNYNTQSQLLILFSLVSAGDYYYLLILIKKCGFTGGSGTTIRHNTQVTHITQNNTTIKRNTLHKTTRTINTLHRMKIHNHNYNTQSQLLILFSLVSAGDYYYLFIKY